MTNILTELTAENMCRVSSMMLQNSEEAITESNNNLDNCGMMSPDTIFKDLERANIKILDYINSLRGKQRAVTPIQIAEELGMSSTFVESILIANGFEMD